MRVFENEVFNGVIDLNEYDDKEFLFKNCKINLSNFPFKIGFTSLKSDKSFFEKVEFDNCEITCGKIEIEKVKNVIIKDSLIKFKKKSTFPISVKFSDLTDYLIENSDLKFVDTNLIIDDKSQLGGFFHSYSSISFFINFLDKIKHIKNCESNLEKISFDISELAPLEFFNELVGCFKEKENLTENEFVFIKNKIDLIHIAFKNNLKIEFNFDKIRSVIDELIFAFFNDRIKLEKDDFDLFFNGLNFIRFFED